MRLGWWYRAPESLPTVAPNLKELVTPASVCTLYLYRFSRRQLGIEKDHVSDSPNNRGFVHALDRYRTRQRSGLASSITEYIVSKTAVFEIV
jgi:hypothetical protein